MRKICFIIFFYVAFLINDTALAVSDSLLYSFQNYNIENGLSHNIIKSITQDENGFLWIGTANGLCRFDGKNVKVFRHETDNPESLPNNVIRKVYADKKGKIWIGTSKPGLLVAFDTRLDKFFFYPLNSSLKIRDIKEDKYNNLWIIFRDSGIKIFNTIDCSFIDFNIPGSGLINELEIDDQNNIWISTPNGLYVKKSDFKQKQTLRQIAGNSSFDEITRVVMNSDSLIWAVRDKKEIWELDFNYQLKRRINIILNHKPVSFKIDKIIQDERGGIWLANKENARIFKLDHFVNDSMHILEIKDQCLNNNILGSAELNQIFFGKEEQIWIATQQALLKFSPYKKDVTHYSKELRNGKSLNDNNIFTFFELTDNELLVATKRGINLLTNEKITRIENRYLNATKELMCEEIWSIEKDIDGNLWFGGKFVIVKYDRKKDQFITYRSGAPDGISRWSIFWSLNNDNVGNLWIGNTGPGIMKFNYKLQNFEVIEEINTDRGILEPDMVSCFYTDKYGNTWFEAENQLVQYNRKKQEYFAYTVSGNMYEPFQLKSICPTHDDKLWLGTEGQGLYLFCMKSKSFILRLSEQNGLPDNTIWGILPASDNEFWLTSNKGLCRIRYENEGVSELTPFDKSSGFQGKLFSQGASFKSSDGRFYVGGFNGFNIFHPDSINQFYTNPVPVITGLQISGRTIRTGDTIRNRVLIDTSLVFKKQIELHHNESNFNIEFTSVAYASSSEVKYAYKLEGFDEEWQFAKSGIQFANYTNIDPGTYTLKIKSSLSGNSWSEKHKSLNIKIDQPWWFKWWALAAYMIIITVIILIVYANWYQQNSLKRAYELEKFENKKNQEVQRIKTEFFMNISHEFKTPLTLILGPIDKLLNKQSAGKTEHYLKLIKRNAFRLKKMINQLLDLRKLESGQMHLNLSEGDPINFIRKIYNEFTFIAEQKEIEFPILISSKRSNKTHEMYFDKDKVEKIVYNLLSNAFKYTSNKGKVTLKIDFTDEYFNLLVSDSGIGIAKENLERIFDRFYQINGEDIQSAGGSGIGLSLAKELSKIHKGELTVKSEKDIGSEFLLSLPVNLYPEKQTDYNEKESLKTIRQREDFYALHQIVDKSGIDLDVIQIIDDNEDIRAFIELEFSERYKVVQSENGEAGIEDALRFTPDLIICDIMMPVMDGITFCKQVKKDIRLSHIPIILLTAKTGDQIHLLGLESGADDFIPKPFNPQILHQKVSNIIKHQKYIKELYSKKLMGLKLEDNETISIGKKEERFIHNTKKIVLDNISDPDFNGEKLAEVMNLSYTNLYRKIKAITSLSLNIFIRNIRLQKAEEMLKSGKYSSVSEVAFELGFSSANYFTKVFSAHFHRSASEFLQK